MPGFVLFIGNLIGQKLQTVPRVSHFQDFQAEFPLKLSTCVLRPDPDRLFSTYRREFNIMFSGSPSSCNLKTFTEPKTVLVMGTRLPPFRSEFFFEIAFGLRTGMSTLFGWKLQKNPNLKFCIQFLVFGKVLTEVFRRGLN